MRLALVSGGAQGTPFFINTYKNLYGHAVKTWRGGGIEHMPLVPTPMCTCLIIEV